MQYLCHSQSSIFRSASLPWHYIDQQSNVNIYGKALHHLLYKFHHSVHLAIQWDILCWRWSHAHASQTRAHLNPIHTMLDSTRDPPMPEYATPLCLTCNNSQCSSFSLYAIPHHLLPAHACNRTRRHDRKLICCCFQWYIKGLHIVDAFLASNSMQCTYSDGCNNVIIFVFWQSTCLHVHAVWKELCFILPVDQLMGNEIKGTWLIHSI